jgi:hypothetical protein
MNLPENVVPMPAEKREELKRLAGARLEWEALRQSDEEYYSHLDQDLESEKAYRAAVSPDVALATLAYVEHLEAALAKSEGQVTRLSPLVRYMRVELHEAKLINNREYADLSQLGGSHILDSYDELRTRAEEAEASLSTTTEQLAEARARATKAESRLAEEQQESGRLMMNNSGLGELLGDVLHELKEAWAQGEWQNIHHLIEHLKVKAGPAPKLAAPVLQEGEAGPALAKQARQKAQAILEGRVGPASLIQPPANNG